MRIDGLMNDLMPRSRNMRLWQAAKREAIVDEKENRDASGAYDVQAAGMGDCGRVDNHTRTFIG
jgi:hypothetical protein